MLSKKLVLVTLLLASVPVCAQQARLSGKILDENQQPIAGATIQVGASYHAISDVEGKYHISNIEAGSYSLSIRFIGFKTKTEKIKLKSGQNLVKNFQLTEDQEMLNMVEVLGKTEATELREEAYAVEVVEMKEFKNLATNGNDILARISGVNIRETGGVGSPFTLSLNGLSGNKVRMFLDGVPMDYFGTSLTLNNFSANLLERVEVYKGVVPVHLSADALGGAINIVTSQNMASYLDLSYSAGSFGTHIASLNTQYRNPSNGFTTKLMAYYNYSDNNYTIPVKLIHFDEFGVGQQDDFYTEVERFHDAYESRMVWLQTGFTRTKFADQLLIGAMYSDNYSEMQHEAFAVGGPPATPYGEVLVSENRFISNLSYKKSGLLKQRLNLDAYWVTVLGEDRAVDTSSFDYDWFGNKVPRNNPVEGEIENRKTHFVLDRDNYLGRFTTEYMLTENSNIAANYSLNYLKLQGSDSQKQENMTQFRNPSDVNKQILALAYTQQNFENRLKSTLFGKYYDYRIHTIETNYSGTETTPVKEKLNYTGYGFSSTYKWDILQIKGSYERAIRFPEVVELFGNGLNIEANPNLLPELSHNLNLGILYNTKVFKNPITFTINGFIRNAHDFIIPITIGLKTRYENYVNVLSRGIDFSSNYVVNHKFFFALNGTYMTKIDNDLEINGQHPQVPNEPYFFGNLSASYRLANVFAKNDKISITLVESYTHSFYFRWEDVGSANLGKSIVPEQLTTNAELVYSLQNERYNISLGIVNLWDAEVYDNFGLQKPGRTLNLKFRFFIN